MKKIFILLTTVAALFWGYGKIDNPNNPPQQSYDLQGKVTRIADGDTFTITSNGQRYRIRMYGIDAPESSQKYGKESTKYLSKIILNKQVGIKIMDKDRYDRIIGKVFYNNQDINERMLESGHAWFYEYYAKNETGYKNAYEDARKNKKALWKDANPENPRDYRLKARKSN